MPAKFRAPERGPMAVAGAANSNQISDAYRDSLLISYDFIGDVNPEISIDLFGKTFTTPFFSSLTSSLM